MIIINQKEDCCGCSACVQICPKHCISMTADTEGFLYPTVDNSLCISCGLCENACPIQNRFVPTEPSHVFAAYNKNEEIRRASSSGGLFSLLAEKTIADGGVVFGAEFTNQWNVVLAYTDTKEGIDRFRGSKYVQAEVRDTFKDCEQFLKAGRKVLFSGTPCQIAGLKRFLNAEYNNLLTVDIICHGVPSPKIWQKYLKEEQEIIKKKIEGKNYWRLRPFSLSNNSLPAIKDIKFRDKSGGWKIFRFILEFAESSAKNKSNSDLSPYYILNEPFHDNTYMKAFLNNLILRPSCHDCVAKCGRSNSDLTIADFWGIQYLIPEIDDDKGISLVMINSKKGREAIKQQSKMLQTVNIELKKAIQYNTYWENSSSPHPCRHYFFRHLNRSKSLINLIEETLQPQHKTSWKRRIHNILNKILSLRFTVSRR